MLEIAFEEVKPETRLEHPEPFSEILSGVERNAPVREPDVVEWMQQAGAMNHVMSPWYRDYGDSGGNLEAMSNDSWYPGVFTTSYQIFRTQDADAVREDGYVRVDNRYGEKVAEVEPFKRAYFDRLRGLVIETRLFPGVQHNTLLGEFQEFVDLPFDGSIRCGAIDVQDRGMMSLPGVFRAKFIRPTMSIRMRLKYEAINPGTLKVAVFDNGKKVAEGEKKSDSGDVTTRINVRSNTLISRKPKIAVAFDDSETGFTIYKARTLMPISFPLIP